MSYLSNYVVAEHHVNLYIIEVFSKSIKPRISKALSSSNAVDLEITHHSKLFLQNLVDCYDYHLQPADRFEDISKEKIVSYFKDTSNTVSLDLFIEADVTTSKVVQIHQDVPVNELVTNLVQKKFPQTFREINSIVDSLWLFVSINHVDEDIPMCQSSR